tara:strand:+ start:638 stop:1369 length:732 start_codon:yes stop_codon:yes gene_type:complete
LGGGEGWGRRFRLWLRLQRRLRRRLRRLRKLRLRLRLLGSVYLRSVYRSRRGGHCLTGGEEVLESLSECKGEEGIKVLLFTGVACKRISASLDRCREVLGICSWNGCKKFHELVERGDAALHLLDKGNEGVREIVVRIQHATSLRQLLQGGGDGLIECLLGGGRLWSNCGRNIGGKRARGRPCGRHCLLTRKNIVAQFRTNHLSRTLERWENEGRKGEDGLLRGGGAGGGSGELKGLRSEGSG